MHISEIELDKHCYLSTVKDGKTTFSILDQKRAETVRILQERYGFPSDKDFINALECSSVEGMDFGRRDVKWPKKYMDTVKELQWEGLNIPKKW